MGNPDMNMTYEMFVRQAFKVERWEDPAHLATTDCFDASAIEEVKAAVGYSMAIFNLQYVEEDNSLDDYCSQALKRVMNATEKKEIYDIIKEYNKKIRHIG